MAQIGPEAMSEVVVLVSIRVYGNTERYTGDESWEEWLGAEVFVVLLEVLLGGGHELNSHKLEAGMNV
jgi:hypothetical protein